MKTNQPIIIKRKRKAAHEGGHGGNWKVAYADFVTAMMAFFLLLWLLNSVTQEQMSGIADYFSPTVASISISGAGGMLSGTSMLSPGPMQTALSEAGVTVSLQPLDPSEEPDTEGLPGKDTAAEASAEEAADAEAPEPETPPVEMSTEELRKILEQQEFERAEAALRAAVEATPELREFTGNLLIDMTSQGMRIQIADAEQSSMFPLGSSTMYSHTEKLLAKVVQVIGRLANDVAVIGHTDAAPYRSGNGYTNWELSTDRANASRRALVSAGLPSSRVVRVVGKADHEPLIEDDPFSPQNRRISILLLRDGLQQPSGG